MGIVKNLFICLPLVLSAGLAHAQDGTAMRNTFYVGGGQAITDDPLKNDDTPFSIGFMHRVAEKDLVLGFDLAGEGTKLDSTWGMDNNLSQGISFNLLVGANLIDTGRFRTEAALLVGLRQTSADCPDSYLGYQCYADFPPDVAYRANFGGVITMSFDKVLLGLRATGESTQLLAGIRF